MEIIYQCILLLAWFVLVFLIIAYRARSRARRKLQEDMLMHIAWTLFSDEDFARFKDRRQLLDQNIFRFFFDERRRR